MILIRDVNTYSPEHLGKKDILICGEKIIYVGDRVDLPVGNFPEIEIIDGSKYTAVPGIVDLHVHIAGAGGEGGYTTRTPRLSLSAFTLNGITTCVGLLGTDGTTRSMEDLLAYARALEIEGITTFLWTGCYQMPTRTITGSARGDIVLIDKIIGIGEIAISDHRGSHPLDYEVIHLASEARVGGLLSGKCGIVHMHIGDGKNGLAPLFHIHETSEIPFENLLPTHINRNGRLYEQSVMYAKQGGYVDITTGILPEGNGEVHPVDAYRRMLESEVSPYNITMSSDAGGSMPIFDEKGRLTKFDVGSPSSDIKILRECVNSGISLETALIPFTSSPAKLLKLKNKGHIMENFDADILLLDSELEINTVISRGKIMVKDGKAVVLGTFEK